MKQGPSPPSYEAATGSSSKPQDAGKPAPAMIPPMVLTSYQYRNRQTGELLTTYLPPDHPEMVCLQQGGHEAETRYGLVGLLAAVFWFPLGVGLCLLDRRVRCRRCGMMIEPGLVC